MSITATTIILLCKLLKIALIAFGIGLVAVVVFGYLLIKFLVNERDKK